MSIYYVEESFIDASLVYRTAHLMLDIEIYIQSTHPNSNILKYKVSMRHTDFQ